jgi:hypothetical protein
MRRRVGLLVALAVIVALAGAAPANAHGFGARYDLPIPLSFYLWGAGAVVALSFAVFALLLGAEGAMRPPTLSIAATGWPGALGCAMATALRLAGVVVLAVVVAAGFLGEQNPVRNIAPAMIWIVGWVGIAFLSPLIGNVWRLLNPWDAVFRTMQWIAQRFGGRSSRQHPWPDRLGVWPAYVLFIAFAWMELVWTGRNVPADLSAALVIYSAITWAGMAMYGRETWLRHGEVFSRAFAIFARFAPVRWPHRSGEPVILRLPASGLLDERPLHGSMVALVIALLATVTFDGLLETPLWARVDVAILDLPPESAAWTTLGLREDQALRAARTLALPCFVLIFTLGYLAICRWMAALSREQAYGTGFLAKRFVLTLVPISLAYHVAHYFSYLLIGGQYVVPLASDPFGWGWNLFGTASYQVDIGVVDPRLQWTVAVVAVVLGHVIAVYLAHVTALRLYRDRRAALISQVPMLLLMVGYTMCSLWILSQPIVETAG